MDNGHSCNGQEHFYQDAEGISRIVFQRENRRVDNTLVLDIVANNMLYGEKIAPDDVVFAIDTIRQNLATLKKFSKIHKIGNKIHKRNSIFSNI